MTVKEASAYIEGLVRFTEKHSNAHTRQCLHLLGDPDQSFPCIHVAGTNGKGSVCAFLAGFFEESGVKTGLFTSPHLVHIEERIRINGEDISGEDFLRAFSRVQDISRRMEEMGEGHPSYFEFLYLMAMVHFQEEHVGAAVIETGLGGRLDATNSLISPLVTVITAIGMDHMQYLGNTIEEIAGEKAGIMKPGVPCVYADDDPRASGVILRHAQEMGIDCRGLRKCDYEILGMQDGYIDFRTSFRYDGMDTFRIHALAPYQVENASLAILAVKTIAKQHESWRDILTANAVKQGLYAMYWPGRMEEVLPHVYLDGAHNDNGIRRFAEAVRLMEKDLHACLCFAVVNDKDYTEMIRDLMQGIHWDEIYVTEIPGARKTDSRTIASLFREAGAAHVIEVTDERAACKEALRSRGTRDLFVTGSLYLIGAVKELIHDQL